MYYLIKSVHVESLALKDSKNDAIRVGVVIIASNDCL